MEDRHQLIRLADDSGVRLGVLGGVSSMLVSEGGPRVLDKMNGARGLTGDQDRTRAIGGAPGTPETLDWFYVSPAVTFGAWYLYPSKSPVSTALVTMYC